jgi:hypothetical protein
MTASIQGAVLDREIKAQLESVLVASGNDATVVADLTALRAAIVYILGAMDTLATKLNADAGVTDVNYVTTNASGHTPAALTTV